MSIFGIGVDIVSNARLLKILQSTYSERFLHKVLHPSEIDEIKTKKDLETKATYLASRWCYKEACVKASGRRELIFPKMYLNKNELGKPFVIFIDENKLIIEKELLIKKTHLSLSHEDGSSIAFVIMEQ